MPLSKYDRYFGGKPGAAQEAHDSMVKQYGAKKGESIFYATKNRNAARAGKPLASAMSKAARKVRGKRKR
jgi:hypothetical protein